MINKKNKSQVAPFVEDVIKDKNMIREVAQLRYDGFGDEIEGASVERYIPQVEEQVYDNKNIPFVMIARLSGQAVGTAGACDVWGGEKFKEYKPWFGCLYVVPEFRRQGIAKLLFETAKEKFIKEGHTKIYLHTPSKENLYVKWGWKRVKEVQIKNKTEVLMEYVL